MNPLQPERRAPLAALRRELDQLPQTDRDVYILWLACNYSDYPLATEPELVAAAHRFGRLKLLQIVDGRPPGNDPDLLQRCSPWRYRVVVSFILRHADKLLSPADEPLLAAIEAGARDLISTGQEVPMLPVEDYARARTLLLQKPQ